MSLEDDKARERFQLGLDDLMAGARQEDIDYLLEYLWGWHKQSLFEWVARTIFRVNIPERE